MSSNRVAWLSPTDPPQAFPDIGLALREPDGLLAAGGDLSSERLLSAYRSGIFPWYDEGQPILWWSPDPRCILRPDDIHISRRLAQYVRRSTFVLQFNCAFADVVQFCAGERKSEQGTWITSDMADAYLRLHEEGWAHSIEIWEESTLVGGLYGLCIGRVFFGESMFSARDNASKFALLGLCRILSRKAFDLIDCQVASQHLATLGASLMPRSDFTEILRSSCSSEARFDGWPEKDLPVAQLLDI